jgi:hypothetical protein
MVIVAGFMPAAGAAIIAHCCTLIIKSRCYIFISSRRERVTVATNPLAVPDDDCCFISHFCLTMP